MGQRFGSPSGECESGTEEEFNWAMQSYQENGFPEIKWFFRKIESLSMPTDLSLAHEALKQWEKVGAFRQKMQSFDNPVFYAEYAGESGFLERLQQDLNQWLCDADRPWISANVTTKMQVTAGLSPPREYYEVIERDFHRLDIAGIDNDKTFEIPLSEIYVRLRVMFDEDAQDDTQVVESGAIDIQTALLKYPKLMIAGDPGSGKSTFLRYIALMLSRSYLQDNPSIALSKLCLPEPLPIPIFLSCWDLADFLKEQNAFQLKTLISFITQRLTTNDFSVSVSDTETLLKSGGCCLLFDGLDEVPTDAGRAAVSRLLEDCVDKYGDSLRGDVSHTGLYG
ncbi:MAG: NACHT domain-containing protein [Algicola sp.]|nr:NACHT domain-containing protein [Algicola sp.]